MGYCNQSRGLNRSSVRSSYTFNLSYIMPSCPDATHRRCGDGRRLLFDLGFGKRAGTPTDVYLLNSSFAMQVDTGSSFQGSVPLFMHLYARSCSPGHSPAEVFDTIHAWEAARLKESQKKALSQLPAQLQVSLLNCVSSQLRSLSALAVGLCARAGAHTLAQRSRCHGRWWGRRFLQAVGSQRKTPGFCGCQGRY